MYNLKKINYVPVLNGSILNCALRENLNMDGTRPTFYTKDGIFKHFVFLINPYHHDEIFKKIKDKGMIIDGCTILADSGGLQEVTLGKLKQSAEEVFKWQQENTNIGFCVDSLPFITNTDGTSKPGSFGGWLFDKKGFIKHAEKTKDNIQVTKPFRDKTKYPNFSFFGIIQGRKYDEYKQWYDVIRDDVYLDGYCVKAPNNNPITLAETCIFAIHNLVKPIHFLGIGNLSRSIVIYYANKYLKQKITYDSSSYDTGAQYRNYHLPFMMTRRIRLVSNHNLGEDSEISNKNDVVHVNDLSKICDCVACRTIGDKCGEMIDSNAANLGGMISIHNLIMNIKWTNYVKEVIDNEYKLREFVLVNFENNLAQKILKAFELIDLSMERGSEYAIHELSKHRNINDEAGQQKGIFNF